MSTHQDKSLETFNDRLREVATELHDTGGHYLLSTEQFTAITAAAQKYTDERVNQELEGLKADIASPSPYKGSSHEMVSKGVAYRFIDDRLAELRKGAS